MRERAIPTELLVMMNKEKKRDKEISRRFSKKFEGSNTVHQHKLTLVTHK